MNVVTTSSLQGNHVALEIALHSIPQCTTMFFIKILLFFIKILSFYLFVEGRGALVLIHLREHIIVPDNRMALSLTLFFSDRKKINIRNSKTKALILKYFACTLLQPNRKLTYQNIIIIKLIND